VDGSRTIAAEVKRRLPFGLTNDHLDFAARFGTGSSAESLPALPATVVSRAAYSVQTNRAEPMNCLTEQTKKEETLWPPALPEAVCVCVPLIRRVLSRPDRVRKVFLWPPR
jgi:hypothetical protein